MCPVIRVSDDLYTRLERLAEGFDTPTKVIERLLNEHEAHGGRFDSRKESPAPTPNRQPELIFHPADEGEFKSLLIQQKKAYVVLHKSDRSTDRSVWRARQFSETSSLRGNLWSGYLRGWNKKGIVKAEFAIKQKDLSRAG
jgi:hypothetical protein